MDAVQFDGVARRLAIGASRRRALGLLLAGGLGGTLGRQEAQARCRPRGRRCGVTCCHRGTFCLNPDTQPCVSLKDTCGAGENYCASGAEDARCGGVSSSCLYLRTFAKKTRCGLGSGNCGECSRDSQGTATYGTGSFCAKDTAGSAHCRNGNSTTELGFCAQPCLG